MPVSKKRRSKQTGRPVRIRPVSPVMLTAFSRGMRSMPGSGCLDLSALDAALCRVRDQNRLDDLKAIATADAAGCIKWADKLAAENPCDSRWDAWRSYRRFEVSYAN